MEHHYLELFKQLIRLKTTHDPENMSEHDRCRDLLKVEAEKRGLKTRLIPSAPYPSLLVGLDVETLAPALMLSCHLDVVFRYSLMSGIASSPARRKFSWCLLLMRKSAATKGLVIC
ncbi:MAG: hypothetical protein HGJ94_00370 [Desulfosarcina sp.]|nr:hypothetical protein [Desulfosarcina sp.]